MAAASLLSPKHCMETFLGASSHQKHRGVLGNVVQPRQRHLIKLPLPAPNRLYHTGQNKMNLLKKFVANCTRTAVLKVFGLMPIFMCLTIIEEPTDLVYIDYSY